MRKFLYLDFLSIFFGSVMAILAIQMTVRSFSPVPYWDMWDGALKFYLDLQEGRWQSWWAQHNEHRIALARVVFFLDYYFLSGSNVLPIVLNLTLVFLNSIVLASFLLAGERHLGMLSVRGVASLFLILGVLSSWMQYENFVWGFQSQFFLAQLLPLMALFALAKSIHGKDAWFGLSVILGTLSLGTMANGVLALPFLFVASLLISSPRIHSMVLLVASIIGFLLYFHGYDTPIKHDDPIHSLFFNPEKVFAFTLIYLGSPFNEITMRSLVLDGLLGGVFFFLLGMCCYFVLKTSRRDPFNVTLLVFIGYIVATSIVTSLGRIGFGLIQATSPRYSTPSLTAWIALAILISRILLLASSFRTRRNGDRALTVSVFLLCAILLMLQVNAAYRQDQTAYERSIGGLAALMGVEDVEQLRILYPDAGTVIRLTERARKTGISFTVLPEYQGIVGKLGYLWPPAGERVAQLPPCMGNLDIVRKVVGTNGEGYLRLDGWLFDEGGSSKDRIVFVDEGGLVQGFAFIGRERPDLITALSTRAVNSGFSGYVRQIGTEARPRSIYATNGSCSMLLRHVDL